MWVILLIVGVIALVFGAMGHLDFRSASFAMDTPSRYVVEGVGGILIVAGLFAAVVTVRAQQSSTGTQRPPIEQLEITAIQATGGPNPRVRVSGTVTPAKAGVNVFLLREDLSGRAAGTFSLAPGSSITDNQGRWEHTANLWMPGPFRVYAAVTTEAYEDLFRFYRRVFDAMLARNRITDPNASSVPGWPNLDRLPTASVVVDRRVDLLP